MSGCETGDSGSENVKLIIWIIALALFIAWLVGLLLGKGGFLHILILCVVAIAVVQWIADRRAARG